MTFTTRIGADSLHNAWMDAPPVPLSNHLAERASQLHLPSQILENGDQVYTYKDSGASFELVVSPDAKLFSGATIEWNGRDSRFVLRVPHRADVLGVFVLGDSNGNKQPEFGVQIENMGLIVCEQEFNPEQPKYTLKHAMALMEQAQAAATPQVQAARLLDIVYNKGIAPDVRYLAATKIEGLLESTPEEEILNISAQALTFLAKDTTVDADLRLKAAQTTQNEAVLVSLAFDRQFPLELRLTAAESLQTQKTRDLIGTRLFLDAADLETKNRSARLLSDRALAHIAENKEIEDPLSRLIAATWIRNRKKRTASLALFVKDNILPTAYRSKAAELLSDEALMELALDQTVA
ncbi:MAG: hypothetical protein HY540_00840, partial [Deltaproteobacteria bacterium]|nr:hypothetical protein [Deltaproteobacteria bacterium]